MLQINFVNISESIYFSIESFAVLLKQSGIRFNKSDLYRLSDKMFMRMCECVVWVLHWINVSNIRY